MSVYNLSEYPTFEDTKNGSSLISESLKLHSLIATCRPRSFVSPPLLAISVYLHCKYASREMIDILSINSFADDYKEVQRLENGMISAGEGHMALRVSHNLYLTMQILMSPH